MTLTDLFHKYSANTDKDRAGGHRYGHVYDTHIGSWRDREFNILMLGVTKLGGGDCQAFLEYFPKAHIYAVDIADHRPGPGVIYRLPQSLLADPRFHFIRSDIYAEATVAICRDRKYDLIIDDALHTTASQVRALQLYWPLLTPAGTYIVEDVGIAQNDTLPAQHLRSAITKLGAGWFEYGDHRVCPGASIYVISLATQRWRRPALMTVAIGDVGKRMLEITGPTMLAYARRINCDFIVIDKQSIVFPSLTGPYAGDRYQIIDVLGDREQAAYIDADCVIAPNCPSIFDQAPADHFCITVNPELHQGRNIRKQMRQLGFTGAFDDKLDAGIYNTGLFVAGSCHREVLNICRHLQTSRQWYNDEPCMHWVLRSLVPKLHMLDNRFNRGWLEIADTLPRDHIWRRVYDQNLAQGRDVRQEWKQAYIAHFSDALGTGVEERLKLLRMGVDHFYGDMAGTLPVVTQSSGMRPVL